MNTDEMIVANSTHNAKLAQILESAKRSSRRGHALGGVVRLLEEAACQARMLALNAAFEAAQAGEQGRAFAASAREVWELAERTKAAAAEISGMAGLPGVAAGRGTGRAPAPVAGEDEAALLGETELALEQFEQFALRLKRMAEEARQ